MSAHLKELSKSAKEISAGKVMLAADEDGSLVKKALLCYEGTFDGMYGQVEVTRDLLQNIADLYNRIKENPTNENDYAPILKDHVRQVDLIQGRLLSGLYLEKWSDPRAEKEVWGLFGSLRIDSDEGKSGVKDGKLAQLSLSFDEETFELFEVSFVAVEAARGAIILSEGRKKVGLEQKLAAISGKHKALAVKVTESRKRRRASLANFKKEHVALMKEAKALAEKSLGLEVSLKAAQCRSKFLGFIKEGKMAPAELKKIDMKAIALMTPETLKVVLAGYENREVSPDVIQHGQSGSQGPTANALDKKSMAKAIELQRAGKKSTVELAGGDGDEDDDADDGKKQKLAGENDKDHMALSEEDHKAMVDDLSHVHAKLGEVVDKLKCLAEKADEMDSAEDEDESQEKKEMSAEDGENEGDK